MVLFYSRVFHHGQSGSKIAPLLVPCSVFWVVEAILLFITLPCLVEFDELSGKTRCRLCFIAYWYIILSVNSFYSKLSFDFWCLPRDLTRIIKLIYSHIRNWSLNWWIFKAIKLQHELINTMSDTMRFWLFLMITIIVKVSASTPSDSVTTGGTRCKQSKHNK